MKVGNWCFLGVNVCHNSIIELLQKTPKPLTRNQIQNNLRGYISLGSLSSNLNYMIGAGILKKTTSKNRGVFYQLKQ